MRAGLVMISPLLPILEREYQLSPFALSFLNAISILCFGAAGLLMPLTKRIGGTNRVISFALSLLTAGVLLRMFDAIFTLYLASLLIGVAIAILNFMLPVWVKEKASASAGLVTGIYITTMGLFAGLAIATAVPLAQATGFGWQLAALPWFITGAVASVFWAFLAKKEEATAASEIAAPTWNFIKNPAAWSITIFFGLQAMLYYGPATWLPTILLARGFELEIAGLLVAVTGLIGSICGLWLPHLLAKRPDLRGSLLVSGLLMMVSFGFMAITEGWLLVFWLTVMSISLSVAFPLALVLTSSRSNNPLDTRSLSIMAQSIGYVMAAFSPAILSIAFDLSGDWAASLLVAAALSLAMGLVGLKAGSASKISNG
ncbi:MAG: hypothetical protein RIR16_839 [Actinomycetota bacterium]|jgi:CP family cyanate transporter-like MFS transporter